MLLSLSLSLSLYIYIYTHTHDFLLKNKVTIPMEVLSSIHSGCSRSHAFSDFRDMQNEGSDSTAPCDTAGRVSS
jgi:hypothetical protein